MTRYLSVTQLRLIIVAANLVLTVTLVLKAIDSYGFFGWGANDEPEEKNPKRIELAKFEYRNQDFSPTKKSGAVEIAMAAGKLQATKPKVLTPSTPETVDTPSADDSGEKQVAYDGGPLEEKGWEYTNYIFWPQKPLETLVYLTKKEEKKSPRNSRRNIRTSGSRGRPTRTTRRNTRTGRNKRSASTRRRQTTPTISSTVGDRWVISEEHDLEFFIDSADREKLVYWMEGSPGELYALKYKASPGWLSEEDRTKIKAPKSEDDESEKEEKKKHFFRSGYLDGDREADYRKMRLGKEVSGSFTPRNTRSASKRTSRPSKKPVRRPISKPMTARQVAAERAKAAKAATSGVGASRHSVPPKVTKEQTEELQKVIEGIPAEDKKKLQEALNGNGNKN